MLRTAIAAVLGSFVVAAFLAVPLFAGGAVPGWPHWPTAVGAIALLLALASLAGAGAVAGQAGGGALSGGLAGGLAGLFGWSLVGGAGVGLLGSAPIFALAPTAPGDKEAMLQLLANSVLETIWYGLLGSVALTVFGAGLGALGGWLTGRGGRLPPMPLGEPAAFGWLVFSSLTALACAAAYDPLARELVEKSREGAFTTRLPPGGLFTVGVGVPMVSMACAVALCTWLATARLKATRDQKGGTAFFPFTLAFGVPLITLGLFALAMPGRLLDPTVIISTLLTFAAGGLAAAFGLRHAHDWDVGDASDYLGNAVANGLLWSGITMGTGISVGLDLAMGTVPYIPTLTKGAAVAPGPIPASAAWAMVSLNASAALGSALVTIAIFTIVGQLLRIWRLRAAGLPQAA
jgi:hypothetical protein